MFVDGRQLPDGTVIETDLAIIGAGAAGISIARELAGSGISVALIESGGFEFDAGTQDLYEGEIAGVDYPLTSSRLRYFGGTTNHWGGWCRPFEPIDFEERDWVPYSGWPVTRAELDPFYERAREVLQIRSPPSTTPPPGRRAAGRCRSRATRSKPASSSTARPPAWERSTARTSSARRTSPAISIPT